MTDQKNQNPTIPVSNTESNIQNSRLPFLRRCSISDPHMDILPHFPHDKAATFNPFNRVFSGLFEGSAFSLNKVGASTESIDKEAHHDHQSPSSRTNQEHLSVLQPKVGSSAVDLKSPQSAAGGTGLRKSATSISALFGSSPQHQHFPAIPENEDQGLVMSARPNAASLSSGENASNLASNSGGASSPQKSGGFMKMFGDGGFLTRPLMHSQEENYRYIMALDR